MERSGLTVTAVVVTVQMTMTMMMHWLSGSGLWLWPRPLPCPCPLLPVFTDRLSSVTGILGWIIRITLLLLKNTRS